MPKVGGGGVPGGTESEWRGSRSWRWHCCQNGGVEARDEGLGGVDRGDLAFAAVLLLIAVAARAPLVSLFEIGSDSADPFRAVLALLDGRRGLVTSSLPFGYGRELSYLPLFLVRPGGLLLMVWVRFVLQALCAPALYLAARASGGERFGGTRWLWAVAAAQLAISPGLLRTLVSGHEGYFAVEWVVVATVLMLRPGLTRGGLVAAGAAFALAVANHPMALATALPLVLLPRVMDARRVAWSLLGCAAVLVPVVVQALPPLADGLLPEWRDGAPSGALGPGGVLLRVFGGERGWEAWLLFGGTALAAGVSTSRSHRRFCLATLGGAVAVVLLATLTQHASAWHWRPLLPLLVLGIAGAPTSRSGRALLFAVALLVLGLSTTNAARQARQQPEQVAQLGVVRLIAGELHRDGPHALVGYLDMPDGPLADFLGVGLELALRRRGRDLVVDRDQMLRSSVLLYAEGEPDFIGRLSAALGTDGFEVSIRGARFVLLRAEDVSTARRVGAMACAAGAHAVRRLLQFDALSLVADRARWRTEIVPAQHRCSVEDLWTTIDPPRHPEELRLLLRETGSGDDEAPLESFQITRFEASWADVVACADAGACDEGPYAVPELQLPALLPIGTARAYCRWRGGRLPSLVEWRRASSRWDPKAGRFSMLPAGGEESGPGDVEALAEVGSRRFSANDVGVEDLMGNAVEWVSLGSEARCAGEGSDAALVGPIRSLLGSEAVDGDCARAPTDGSVRGGVRCVR